MNTYRNPWADKTLVRRPAFYMNNAKAVYSANGWTVYKTHERGYDYVFAGCCITQRAGATKPAETIANILSGAEYVCDTVGAHLRANGLTCKTYEDAHAEAVADVDRTCRERLNMRGLTTERAGGNYRRRVLADGKPVFEGTAYEISLWLNSSDPANPPGYAGPAPAGVDHSDWLAINNID